ncbi:ABC transporter permease [Nocardioides sp. InS609-2]|uniref:ABC transporter permease n=1 Tax=Nocardioides sp. InS609-2 TaxID=2760705 RepID=UPI0020BF0D24|nr:ABC transporter permease [Nocardioides sp. InS609-2]
MEKSSSGQARTTGWLVRRTLVGVLLFGALVQVVLIIYYLGAAHSPRPHHLPVGYISTDAMASEVEAQIEEGGSFAARRFTDEPALTAAVRAKDIYGGVDLTSEQPELYLASAAGTSAATAIRNTFTEVVERRRADQVQRLVAAGRPVPADTVEQLTEPPSVTDLVPLPDADRGGTSLGLLVQVLAIGATIASIELGKLGVHTTRSARRGFVHAAVLVLYGIVSAAAVAVGASLFGVIPSGEVLSLFASFALLSLALSCSVAAAVALLGPGGAMLGTLYFLVGIVISGSSVVPEFLPSWARVLGQALPPGSGASLIRERLYFPDASVAGPASVLAGYAVVGLVVVLITNALPSTKVRAAP